MEIQWLVWLLPVFLFFIRRVYCWSADNAGRTNKLYGIDLLCYGVGNYFYLIGAYCTSGLQLVSDGYTWLIILGLALPATAISNITLVQAIKYAGPTLTSILGAMEPLTAVVIGVFVFKELFTVNSAVGIILILLAVSIVVFRRQNPE